MNYASRLHLVGEGSASGIRWHLGFSDALLSIRRRLVEARQYNLRVDWHRVLGGLRAYERLARRHHENITVEALFAALEHTAIICVSSVESDSAPDTDPVCAYVSLDHYQSTRVTLECIALRIDNYYKRMGYQDYLDRVYDQESKREQKEWQERFKLQRRKREILERLMVSVKYRHIQWLLEKLRVVVSGSGEPCFAEYDPILATSNQGLFVVTGDSFGCRNYRGTSWQLCVEKLKSEGVPVTECYEGYPSAKRLESESEREFARLYSPWTQRHAKLIGKTREESARISRARADYGAWRNPDTRARQSANQLGSARHVS